ncbi:MAG: insulinase family protein [Rickettsiales bacterium]|jgi:predicted Zn-dependent peptidase|nr:insulinase family protein [Rickettsiales bacterium]
MIDIITLKNGVRIINEYMADVESVSINVWVKTGSCNETKKQSGISHFLEHMAFKGTTTRNTKQIAEEFDDLGGRANAFTSKNNTAFYTKVLKEHTEKAVELLADIFQNSIFDEKELEKERKVILQEYGMMMDDPGDLVGVLFGTTAYKNQPYGREIIGTKKNIESFTKCDIQDYINSQYKGKNIIISFAGKCKTEDVEKYVKKYFTNIKEGENVKPKKSIYTGGECFKNKKLEQTQIILGWEGISNDIDKNNKFYEYIVLSILLGGGMSSRLFQEIREKRGLCYNIFAFSSSNRDCGCFGVDCAVSPNKVVETIKATKEVMQTTAKKITKDEFDRTITKFKTNIVLGRESNSNRAQKNASNLLLRDKIISLEEEVERINKITIKDLQNDLQDILTKKTTITVLGKVDNALKEKVFL